MEKYNAEFYQVYSVGDNDKLVITEHKAFEDAEKEYNEKDGFMLIGIDAPQCFNVIYARPVGISLLS